MPAKKENSKKVAGNAKKAAAAEAKNAKENAVKAAKEDAEWADGAKTNAKKYSSSLFIQESLHSSFWILFQYYLSLFT